MNNEIKEILNKLKNHIEHIRFANLTNYELRLFYDYITNLQEENEKNKEYSEFYKDMSDKWKEMSDVFKKSCKDYKSRIDKAIEYIGNPLHNYWEEESKYLLNILKGSDKE